MAVALVGDCVFDNGLGWYSFDAPDFGCEYSCVLSGFQLLSNVLVVVWVVGATVLFVSTCVSLLMCLVRVSGSMAEAATFFDIVPVIRKRWLLCVVIRGERAMISIRVLRVSCVRWWFIVLVAVLFMLWLTLLKTTIRSLLLCVR